MSDGESPKLVNVDPRCIQEALRMYLQPIKNDDPQIDFYTMYKRETVEYDTEYMQKHNEDLNTTLIFAGLFSAVSSAFVIDVQSKLEPDSGERSEAYLRAILFSLNRSISPDEDPTAPPVWSGPPQEIITASDFLYASLLMSLLAAFVAMLGKQWLNRYLRHTGGSTIERCGDRQRKFDGLERWPFRLFIESLPVMLQIALLLLACGLSRHMWSVNTSVARVVISFTVIGFLFYVAIVVAGTSSYECPFQTPASMALRYLRDSKTTRKWLSSLSPTKIVSLIYITIRKTPKLLARLSLPNSTSLIYTTLVDAREGIVSASRRAHDITRQPLSWGLSVSGVPSGIRRTARKIGHRIIILLLQMDRAFGNAKQRLSQEIRRLKPTGLLPTSARDVHHQPSVPHNGPGLRVRVRNLEGIRRQDADNARCVCWVLRNITDPEAIDSAIRLAGTIRWFDGDSDHNPPFDLIVSTLETCFDSTKQLYPGMRDRAYFSARAVLQISTRARIRSQDHASKYPIPAVSADAEHLSRPSDRDLFHLIYMLELNLNTSRPILLFPGQAKNTSLWLSNLFVDLTHVGQNPILQSYSCYLDIARNDHQATISNILLMWYMFLGGHVEEETIWAVDKSDSLETILSHLSTRVMDAIANGNCVRHLKYLFNFLEAWEKRPPCLTPMAYQWCSALSGVITEPSLDVTYTRQAHNSRSGIYQIIDMRRQAQKEEDQFTEVGPGCDLVHRARECRRNMDPHHYAELFFKTLKIGFRLAQPHWDPPVIHPNHTPQYDRMFEIAFSSGYDEVIADAVCAWVKYDYRTPAGSLVYHFADRVKRTAPFSRRLRQMAIHAIPHIWSSELTVSALEIVRLLNHLEADVDDLVVNFLWVDLLAEVIRSPAGFENLSSRYWSLLDKLILTAPPLRYFRMSFGHFTLRDAEVMGLLEEAEDWGKLEAWMEVAWRSLEWFSTPSDSMEDVPSPELMEGIEQVTLKLSLQQPSALQRFENLCENRAVLGEHRDKLRGICDRARAGQLPSGSPPPPKSVHAQPSILPFWGDDTF